MRVPSKYPGKLHFKGPRKGLPSGNPLGKNPSDVWTFLQEEWETGDWDIPNVKANHIEKTVHPCQFPVELVERCVLALTKEHDSVLDPYCGVGSTLIAALMHGRRAIGVEREAQYAALTKERIEQLAQGTLKTRPLGKPVQAYGTGEGGAGTLGVATISGRRVAFMRVAGVYSFNGGKEVITQYHRQQLDEVLSE